MKIVAIAITMLALASAPAHAKDREATASEKQVAIQDYMNCLFASAETLDDNISDAMSIGGSVGRGCREQLGVMVDVLARGYNQRVRESLMDRRIAGEAEAGADAVLTVRAKRRAASAP